MEIRALILSLLFMYPTCAMQEHKHKHHEHSRPPQVLVIEIPVAQQQEQKTESPHTQEVTYRRKVILASIGFATAVIGGGTALIIFFTK